MRRVAMIVALGALLASLAAGCKPKQQSTDAGPTANPPGKVGAAMGPKGAK